MYIFLRKLLDFHVKYVSVFRMYNVEMPLNECFTTLPEKFMPPTSTNCFRGN